MENKTTSESKLLAISSLSRSDLIERWTEGYGQSPPIGISRRLLEFSSAYALQTQVHGGLSQKVRRRLNRELNTADSSPPKRKLSPGTRLVRDWHGRTHSVEVLESGFCYRGRVYVSLTKIAREITDAHWSGPRFFGL